MNGQTIQDILGRNSGKWVLIQVDRDARSGAIQRVSERGAYDDELAAYDELNRIVTAEPVEIQCKYAGAEVDKYTTALL